MVKFVVVGFICLCISIVFLGRAAPATMVSRCFIVISDGEKRQKRNYLQFLKIYYSCCNVRWNY